MSVGLVRIETRRSTALWLTPVMVALAWALFRQRYTGPFAVSWSDRSMAIRDVAQPTWPLIAGAAAWMAGRLRRRGMAELLATTPYPAWGRELTTWAGAITWGVLAYVLVASVILVETWTQATWGKPDIGPMAVGLLALLASGAVGYTLGYSFPSRFTPPLVSIGVFVSIGLTYNLEQWYSFLAPPAHGETTVWGIVPDLSGAQSLFLLGLMGGALSVLWLLTSKRWAVTGPVLVASIALAATGIVLVSQGVPRDAFTQPMQLSEVPISHITPACSHGLVTVCVHPGYRRQLPELSRIINRIAAPLAGVPGVRLRAIDSDIVVSPGQLILGTASSPDQEARLRRDGLYVFDTIPVGVIVFHPGRAEQYPATVAVALVIPNIQKGPPTGAQEAIAIWLAQRAGYNSDLCASNGIFGLSNTGVPEAARRFAALPAVTQTEWLRAHFSALVAGQVSPGQLP